MTNSAPTPGFGSLAVVIPVYKSRSYLPELHQRLTDVLKTLSSRYELVFVDDAGHDGSLEWLRQCREEDPRVTIIENPENLGQHRAIVAGLSTVGTDIVVVMDADLQDPPEAIPRLVETLRGTAGVVFARRVSRFASRGRHVTSHVFKRLLRLISGSRVPKDTGMFFVTTGEIARAAAALASDTPYVPLLLDRTGCRLTATAVEKQTLIDGASTYTARRRLRLATQALTDAVRWRLATTRRRRRSEASPTGGSHGINVPSETTMTPPRELAEPDRSSPTGETPPHG